MKTVRLLAEISLWLIISIQPMLGAGDERCDNCRTIMSIPGHDWGDTSTMTQDGGLSTAKDAWYLLEIPSSASCPVTICMSAPASDCWDTYLSVWNSSCSTALYSNDDNSSSCSSGLCSGGPWGGTLGACQSVITATLPSGIYYICCEGWYSDSDGPYCLEVSGSCSGCDCSYAYPISCETGALYGENNGQGPPASNCYSTYSGWPYDASGPEKLYYFNNNTDVDQAVLITLDNLDPGEDLDIFALNNCSNSAFDADDTEVYIFVPAGETYYISVDGYLGSISSYDLLIDCESICDLGSTPIYCNQTLADQDTSYGWALWDSYNCTGYSMIENELIYSLEVDASIPNFTATLSGMSVDLDLMVLEHICDNDTACVAFGENSVSIDPAYPGTYYLVVDGISGQSGTFDLSVTCSGQPPTATATITPGNPLDCTSPVSLSCGSSYSGNTTTGQINVSFYNCVGYEESGPEKVHQFTLATSNTVTLTMEPLGTQDLDLFLLESCSASACIAYSAGTSLETITQSLAAGVYYVVVDGYRNAAGAYNIWMNCGNTPTPRPTYTITRTPTSTPTVTRTPTPSNTPTPSPTITVTPTITPELPINCLGAIDLACDTSFDDTTEDGLSRAVHYNCTGTAQGSPEKVFRVTTSQPMQINAQMIPQSGVNLNLFLLSACDQNQCIASSTLASGTETITSFLSTGDYYLVVDAPDGQIGTFNIYYSCLFSNTATPTQTPVYSYTPTRTPTRTGTPTRTPTPSRTPTSSILPVPANGPVGFIILICMISTLLFVSVHLQQAGNRERRK